MSPARITRPRSVWTLLLGLLLGCSVLVLPAASGLATVHALPGLPDCQEAPVPAMPGRGLPGYFSDPPETLPPVEDPFAEGSSTTIYQQYGYAGLRWHSYDLGCGPDAMRNPDAVIGTTLANWMMQPVLALTALTGEVTEAAFHPTFLDGLDPIITQVSDALHDSLFASWVPAVLALIGVVILYRSRRSGLSTTAAAIGWALLVLLVTTAVVRWPLAAGHTVDATVTSTLGSVVKKLDGYGENVDPGTAVASHLTSSIYYRSWLAGTFGSADSATAREYGDDLFKAQALTWREARIVRSNPERGEEIIEAKQERWSEVAERIEEEDPQAYEYLTGRRSATRMGYAMLAAVGGLLALPFLLVSALLLIGCYLIVRLGVMLLPAFAVLGLFPAARGLVIGLGRTVGSAVVNAIIFGIGAAVTITVLGILYHPAGSAPGWLGLVLMPLFSFMMWVALRPFRRLSHMVSPNDNHFGSMTDSFGAAARSGSRMVRRGAVAAVGGMAGGFAGAAAADAATGDGQEKSPQPDEAPERVEARASVLPGAPEREPAALPHGGGPRPGGGDDSAETAAGAPSPGPAPSSGGAGGAGGAPPIPDALDEEPPMQPSGSSVPPAPREAPWDAEEEVYEIYRPDAEPEDHDVA